MRQDRPTERQRYVLLRPVVFVGFMGAGKTSVARRLARNVGLVAVDADTFFAHDAGMSAGDFIRTHGEAAFRDQETAVLKELLGREHSFISCGGGIVEREENRRLLQEPFVVYLRVSAEEARSRISSLQSRPLFGDMEQAAALNRRRAPLYEAVADVIVDTAGKSVPALAARVERLLVERGILCPERK